MSWRQRALLVVIVPATLIGAWLVGQRWSGDEPPGNLLDISAVADTEVFEHDYLIPAGTRAKIEAGDAVDVVPGQLTVFVGDSIRIVNDDTVGHQVGVFYVGAGETLMQRFNRPGVLTDSCDVHSSGTFTLTVVAAT